MQGRRKNFNCHFDAVKKAPSGKPGISLIRSHLNEARRWPRLALIAVLLFLTAHRLPAPVTELPDNPTPAPEQAPKPKWKRPVRAKSRTTGNENESAKAPATLGPGKFAGNWFGTINQGVWGDVKVALVVNANGSSVKMTAGERPATVNSNTVAWKSGLFNEITWTLTPQGSGTTALVTSKSGLGVNGTATFNRTQNSMLPTSTTKPAPEAKPAATPIANTQPPNIPIATPVPDKPGFVYNPFDPNKKLILDVRGITSGAKVIIPASGKQFIVP
jgi:hypothetical protein